MILYSEQETGVFYKRGEMNIHGTIVSQGAIAAYEKVVFRQGWVDIAFFGFCGELVQGSDPYKVADAIVCPAALFFFKKKKRILSPD